MFARISSYFSKPAATAAPSTTAAQPAAEPVAEIDVPYVNHEETVIIACYFNPKHSEYRRKGFNLFYQSIKHCNHRIVECCIGDDEFELEETESIKRVRTDCLLWHKESLLNMIIKDLPETFRYVLWVDADILFTNKNWMVDAAAKLAQCTVIQLFEFCVHLEQDETKPSKSINEVKAQCLANEAIPRADRRVWRSFAANFETRSQWDSNDYDIHGHVGFAWGCQRQVLTEMGGLYDKALIGGADHIMAHAVMGQVPHQCIQKAFVDPADMEAIVEWSNRFYTATQGKLGFVQGDVYHIWHGDLKDREYLKRIQDFSPMTKSIVEKDGNGLYKTSDKAITDYASKYFNKREVCEGEDDSSETTCRACEPATTASAGGYYENN